MTKRLMFTLMLCIIGLAAALQALSQTPAPATPQQQQQQLADRLNEQRKIAEEERRIREDANKISGDFIKDAKADVYEDLAKKNYPYKPLTAKERAEIMKALEPGAEDQAKYAGFLKKKKTGLFRLMPNLGCVEKNVIKVDEGCERSTVFGEYYSFAAPSYGYKDVFDLTFKDGNFYSTGVLKQGIITSLGDVSLETLSASSSGVKYLLDYVPQTDNKLVKKQFAEIAAKINADGYVYAKSAAVVPGNTYAMRVISYRFENSLFFDRFRKYQQTTSDFRLTSIAGTTENNNRVDLTVVFQVVRQDTDGSLIILWKEIARDKAQIIKFAKDETLSNF